MTSFGKILSLIMAVLMLASVPCAASENEEFADVLYELGLFKGTDKGYELDKEFTREEAAVILVRLLGEEENLEEYSYDAVFLDVPENRWSFGYVMYCYDNLITKGTSSTEFSPENPITAQEFTTLLLRLLGFTDAEPENSLEACIYMNMLNSEVVRKYESSDAYLRDDMVYTLYRSLMCQTSNDELFADFLAEKGVISSKQAKEFDIFNNFEDINSLIDDILG